MQVQTVKIDEYAIVTISGRIDATTSPELEDELLKLIDDGTNYVILDMADVPYLSSAGLRILLLAVKQLYSNGQLGLCNLQESVLEIIEMAGFSNFMSIFDTRQEAAEKIML